MAKTVISLLIETIEKEIEIYGESLTRGKAASYEEYREVCGFLRGLELAKSTIKDLSQKYEEYEDD